MIRVTKSDDTNIPSNEVSDIQDSVNANDAQPETEELHNQSLNVEDDSATVPDISKYLEWVRENEKHAAATVIGYIIPLLYPGSTFVEVGSPSHHTHIHYTQFNSSFLTRNFDIPDSFESAEAKIAYVSGT
eukprot:Seg551.8 transcript_id=Seg551.8/GoldUCD/mRNA.D3Y31 product="hypothetical protein" protein_id=Seg551.8/GoldUCD/D3Y31